MNVSINKLPSAKFYSFNSNIFITLIHSRWYWFMAYVSLALAGNIENYNFMQHNIECYWQDKNLFLKFHHTSENWKENTGNFAQRNN